MSENHAMHQFKHLGQGLDTSKVFQLLVILKMLLHSQSQTTVGYTHTCQYYTNVHVGRIFVSAELSGSVRDKLFVTSYAHNYRLRLGTQYSWCIIAKSAVSAAPWLC